MIPIRNRIPIRLQTIYEAIFGKNYIWGHTATKHSHLLCKTVTKHQTELEMCP